MNKKLSLLTSVAVGILMVGLSSHGVAQTDPRRIPFNERHLGVNNPLMAAKLAAGRVARSKGAVTLRRSKAAGTFLTFDVPGASEGTFPVAVSASGLIVGRYNDSNYLSHGFLRFPNGAFVTFDVPGAVNGTYPEGVTDDGSIVGGFGDNVGSEFHSFIRDRKGKYTTFDPPVQNTGSSAKALSWDGTSIGSYGDENYLSHGFLRTPRGKIITFDAPGATTYFGTNPIGITADGRIFGYYSYKSTLTGTFGFLLSPFGGSTEIAGPGGLDGQWDPYGTGPALSINPFGEIAGTYFQPISGNPFGGNFRVFVRSRDGKYVTFDAATYSPCCIWSAPSGINVAGTVAGSFNDGYSVYHGFWRTPGGTVSTFDVPGAGTGSNQGTLPIGITDAGVIAGSYRDANTLTHGFLFRPRDCFGWSHRHC